MNREISEETALTIIEIALNDDVSGEEQTVSVSLDGEGMSLDRSISETTGVELIDVAVHDGRRAISQIDGQGSEGNVRDSLPKDFFTRLSEKQRVMIEILLQNEGTWMRGKEIRQVMREDYEMDIPDSGRATAGVIAGLTRKYDEEFRRDIIEGQWADDSQQNAEFRIGDRYREELSEVLGTDE